MPHAVASPRTSPRTWLALALVAGVAALLLFHNLGARYLWQDEAACAIMAERLMETGRPAAYDGMNLITMDVFDRDQTAFIAQRTATPESALEHFIEQGDFKDDTTWIGQPWGQFVFAGVSMKLFGRGTITARLPFVIAAILTAVVLFGFVRRRFDDPLMAAISVVLLLGCVYWFLHARQCRYYATATLFLLLTLVTYLRWQDGQRFGAALFVLTAWVWFHNDFGSFWPVMGVLTVDAFRSAGRRWKRPLVVLAAVGLCVLPFVVYYELHTRLKEPIAPWPVRYALTLYYQNHYQLPLLFFPAAGWMLWRGKRWRSGEKRVIGLTLAIILAQLAWMPLVGPTGFYRYVVDLTPLSCLVMAFVLVRAVRRPGMEGRVAVVRGCAAAAAAAFVLVSPLPALLTTPRFLIEERYLVILPPLGTWVRGEWTAYAHELASTVPDPNRRVVERLAPLLEPGDEIVINYEDAPLMFYLRGHPIRGGIPCFRLADPGGRAPRFLVIRERPRICHRPAYDQFIRQHQWKELEIEAPDIPWGANPDPSGHFSRWVDDEKNLRLWENVDYVGR